MLSTGSLGTFQKLHRAAQKNSNDWRLMGSYFKEGMKRVNWRPSWSLLRLLCSGKNSRAREVFAGHGGVVAGWSAARGVDFGLWAMAMLLLSSAVATMLVIMASIIFAPESSTPQASPSGHLPPFSERWASKARDQWQSLAGSGPEQFAVVDLGVEDGLGVDGGSREAWLEAMRMQPAYRGGYMKGSPGMLMTWRSAEGPRSMFIGTVEEASRMAEFLDLVAGVDDRKRRNEADMAFAQDVKAAFATGRNAHEAVAFAEAKALRENSLSEAQGLKAGAKAFSNARLLAVSPSSASRWGEEPMPDPGSDRWAAKVFVATIAIEPWINPVLGAVAALGIWGALMMVLALGTWRDVLVREEAAIGALSDYFSIHGASRRVRLAKKASQRI